MNANKGNTDIGERFRTHDDKWVKGEELIADKAVKMADALLERLSLTHGGDLLVPILWAVQDLFGKKPGAE